MYPGYRGYSLYAVLVLTLRRLGAYWLAQFKAIAISCPLGVQLVPGVDKLINSKLAMGMGSEKGIMVPKSIEEKTYRL